jgi:hypothetical protein
MNPDLEFVALLSLCYGALYGYYHWEERRPRPSLREQIRKENLHKIHASWFKRLK